MQEAYIADSESSSIRAVNLKTGGSRLIVGGDPLFPENLFRVLIEVTLLLYFLSFLYIFLILFLSLVNNSLVLLLIKNTHFFSCFQPSFLRYSQIFIGYNHLYSIVMVSYVLNNVSQSPEDVLGSYAHLWTCCQICMTLIDSTIYNDPCLN